MDTSPLPQADLHGRTVLITGANAGIGYWCAEQLAARGARVLLGCRSTERAEIAVTAIQSQVKDADLRIIPLDLGSLESVALAAAEVAEPLDAIICNAGVKAAKHTDRTSDGFDLMVGTNFLGHFALVAQLEPLLAGDGRVVTVGSLAHRFAPLDPASIGTQWQGASLRHYGRSKAALMAFTFALAERWSDSQRIAVCAHPGYAVDPLTPPRPGLAEVSRLVRTLAKPTRVLVQGKDGGALPIVHATTGIDIANGDYWGPSGLNEFRGAPVRVSASDEVRSPETGAALWAAAERLTEVPFPD